MGFYKDLSLAINKEKDNRKPSLYSQLRLNTDIWYSHLRKLTIEVCEDSKFWLEYWLTHEVKNPTSEDLEELRNMRDSEHIVKDVEELRLHMHIDSLNAIMFVLSVSLKALILNNHGTTETAKALNQFWLNGNIELKKRGIETLDFNPYDVDMKAKAEGKLIELTPEQSKTFGICPNCLTKKYVVSNGSMWKCKNCGRNFRKNHSFSSQPEVVR